MRKNVSKILDLPSNGVTAALIIMSIAFLVGGFAGCTLSSQANRGGEAVLNRYLDGFLDVVSSGETAKPEFIFLLWKAIRWPLFSCFLGFTPIGLIGIPALFLIRAFLLSFSIASFYYVSGMEGLFIAFIIFGITGLVYIPILFIFGLQDFLRAGTIVGRITGENRYITKLNRAEHIRSCLGVFVLFVCSFIEYSAVPAILKLVTQISLY